MGGGGRGIVHSCPTILNFRVRIRVGFKISVRVRVKVKDRVRLEIIKG